MLAINPFMMPRRTMLDAMNTLTHAPFRAFHTLDTPHLTENDDGTYALSLSAPGVAASDLECKVERGVLKISGRTKTHSMSWATSLPSDADVDNATVTTTDGIVNLVIPKKAPAEPKAIAVSATPTDAEASPSDDDDASYHLTVSAPGFAASDLHLETLDDGVLKVSGESKVRGKMAQRYRLPRDADLASASATHIDGLLTVTIPKRPETAAKTLVVNKANERGAEAMKVTKEAEDDSNDFEMV